MELAILGDSIHILTEVTSHLKDGQVFKTLDFAHNAYSLVSRFKIQVSSFKVAMLLELSFGKALLYSLLFAKFAPVWAFRRLLAFIKLGRKDSVDNGKRTIDMIDIHPLAIM
jgi:hypothetical protein